MNEGNCGFSTVYTRMCVCGCFETDQSGQGQRPKVKLFEWNFLINSNDLIKSMNKLTRQNV
jgi:hypothetical protein